MYAQLDLCFTKSVTGKDFLDEIASRTSLSACKSQTPLNGTALESYSADIELLAAEQIQHLARVIYCAAGHDRINVHISAGSIEELKLQSKRVASQFENMPDGNLLKSAMSRLFVVDSEAETEDVVATGTRFSVRKRILGELGERTLGRVVPAAVAFAIAASYLAGTPFFQSSLVGMVAALVGWIGESSITAMQAEEWVWKGL